MKPGAEVICGDFKIRAWATADGFCCGDNPRAQYPVDCDCRSIAGVVHISGPSSMDSDRYRATRSYRVVRFAWYRRSARLDRHQHSPPLVRPNCQGRVDVAGAAIKPDTDRFVPPLDDLI